MKKLKKLLSMICVLTLVMTLAACGNSETTGTITGEANPMVMIDDIEWEMKSNIIDGDRYLTLEFTNNSYYDIYEFMVSYIQKEEVSEKDVDAFWDYTQDLFGVEDISDTRKNYDSKMSMYSETKDITDSHSTTSDGRYFWLQSYYYAKPNDFTEMMEPDIIAIKFIYNDNIYTEYYDCLNNDYTIEDDIEEAMQWSDSELAQMIVKPEAKVIEVFHDDDSRFEFYAYGISKDYASQYNEELKGQGFTNIDIDDYDMFKATNDDGYKVNVTYFDDNHELNVEISKE